MDSTVIAGLQVTKQFEVQFVPYPCVVGDLTLPTPSNGFTNYFLGDIDATITFAGASSLCTFTIEVVPDSVQNTVTVTSTFDAATNKVTFSTDQGTAGTTIHFIYRIVDLADPLVRKEATHSFTALHCPLAG